MATHPIPQGTCNFAINLPIPLRREAGRLAAMQDAALGRWIRDLLEREVEFAKLRGALDAAGQITLRLPVVALGFIGAVAVIAQMFAVDSDQVARRIARRGRRRDEIELVVEC